LFDHRRVSNEPRHEARDHAFPRFPSIIGALIIAVALLLSTLILTVGSRYVAVETANEDSAWLVDRLTGNLYKCHAEQTGKALCESEIATANIGAKSKR
jgi:hypothetical protein